MSRRVLFSKFRSHLSPEPVLIDAGTSVLLPALLGSRGSKKHRERSIGRAPGHGDRLGSISGAQETMDGLPQGKESNGHLRHPDGIETVLMSVLKGGID
jgi:hypothetical protein